ncbi:ABC transporter permease [Halorubellus salinus]|uniref:ABC transporter permease n=1 Tax=Halorubellus salinus TaxID=755309 RepID=UPI001D08AED9|nr:ABC transporter permease [Halorubellus salinus]
MKPTETDSQVGGVDWSSSNAAATDLSRLDRYRDLYQERVYKPAVVAWSDWRTRFGLLIVGFYVVVALIAALGLYPSPETNQAPRYLLPLENMDYVLGTTATGTDLLALLVHATPEMMLMITSGAIWATGVAVVLGTVAGFKGGTTDRVLMAIADFVMAIPGLPLIMILAIAFTPENPLVLGVLITLNYWAGLGRSIRSQVLTIREQNYVEASRTMGTPTHRIIRKDIIPNLMPYVTVNFVTAARYVIFASVGLYFLGVLPIGAENWGITMYLAYSTAGALYTIEAAHWLIAPMLAILFLSLGLILLGQGMDRVFNPRVRTRLAGESESTAGSEAEDSNASTEIL